MAAILPRPQCVQVPHRCPQRLYVSNFSYHAPKHALSVALLVQVVWRKNNEEYVNIAKLLFGIAIKHNIVRTSYVAPYSIQRGW